MTEEEVRKKMQEGYRKVSPMVAQTTNLIMDAYQEGFKTCWELLTGQSWESFNELSYEQTSRKNQSKG